MGVRPLASSAQRLRFDSEFDPRDPEARAPWARHAANRTAHAILWRHPREPRPTLVLLGVQVCILSCGLSAGVVGMFSTVGDAVDVSKLSSSESEK